jgi:serine/threonine protein kinase
VLIRKGSFGWIYIVEDVYTHYEYAGKFEKKSRDSLLNYENHVLCQLQGEIGIPTIHYFGEKNDFYIMIMDLLGDDLESILDKNGRKLSVAAVGNIG